MNHEAMTDRDYQRLSDTLDRFHDQGCMNLEELDGFFTALLSGPLPVKPTECLPVILGQAFDDEAAFPGNQALERFASLLLRHWFDIAHTLQEGAPFHPWLEADQDGIFHGNDWARGFVTGMELMYDDWTMLLDDAQHSTALAPIMALAFEGESDEADEAMRAWIEQAGPEQRAEWLAAISGSVAEINAFFSELRTDIEQEHEQNGDIHLG
jgi:uncharacterized protein